MKKIYAGLFLLMAILVIVVVVLKTVEPQKVSYDNYVDNTELPKDVAQIEDLSVVDTVEQEVNYDYLFTSSTTDEYSNIVGTISYEAFAWYVPGWLAENWSMQDSEGKGYTLTFTPKGDIKVGTISPISIYVEPSTETFNAQTMYEEAKKGKSVLLSEILLSEHAEGMLHINIESETRIYHVRTNDVNAISDMYFIDGNNKTLRLVFYARKDLFSRYESKIRDMVKGIAEVKPPQG